MIEKIVFTMLMIQKLNGTSQQKKGFLVFYRHGKVSGRSRYLRKDYSIDLIQFKESNTVIYCGVNWGDLYPDISKQTKINNHTFMSSKLDYDVL